MQDINDLREIPVRVHTPQYIHTHTHTLSLSLSLSLPRYRISTTCVQFRCVAILPNTYTHTQTHTHPRPRISSTCVQFRCEVLPIGMCRVRTCPTGMFRHMKELGDIKLYDINYCACVYALDARMQNAHLRVIVLKIFNILTILKNARAPTCQQMMMTDIDTSQQCTHGAATMYVQPNFSGLAFKKALHKFGSFPIATCHC